MKKSIKIAVNTLNACVNLGNRLQNYALVNYLNEHGFDCYNYVDLGAWEKIKTVIKKFIPTCKFLRIKSFLRFNDLIKSCYKNYEFDLYIIGSDQVWNYTWSNEYQKYLLLDKDDYSIISYAASFGVDYIDEEHKEIFKKGLQNFKYISVREDSGKKIVVELTGRTDVEVLIDPTMLLTPEEWDKVSKKPKMLKEGKFVLNYFLGNLSQQRREAIDKFAKEHDCYVINILDKKSPFYVCGPSEFLYLEKHAEMIFTDSFHSSVFAILYNSPFVIFDREQEGMENMGSRLDTLLSKFELKNRRYNGKEITKENFEHDYTRAYVILELEREKSRKFLEKALDINK